MSSAQEQLEAWVDEQIAAGADVADVIAALEAMDAGEADETHAATVSGFRIKHRAGGDPVAAGRLAQWALNKYRRAAKRMAEVDAIAAAQVAQVEAWRKHEAQKTQGTMDFFGGVLHDYHDDFAPDEKTLPLVGGKLKVRKNRDVISWQDDLARQWALQQPNVDDLAPRAISRSAIKSGLTKREDGSYVTADGEVVDFVHDVPPQEPTSFSVELED